jgi:hypothetical protein
MEIAPGSTTRSTNLQVEKNWTVRELSSWLRVSPDTVRRLFKIEEGVIVLGNRESTPGKRRYRTLLIPHSVATRVLRRMSVRQGRPL